MDVVNMILLIVYIVVGIALVWFVVELALTIRKTRTTVDDMQKQLEPTLANVQQLTDDAKPLVERLSLTVDAVNLEMLRVDDILQDVSGITDTASKAATAVDNVTSAPLNIVNSLTEKLRDRLTPKRASDISKEMGENKTRESVDEAVLNSIDADVPATAPAVGYTPVEADIDVPAGHEATFTVPADGGAHGQR